MPIVIHHSPRAVGRALALVLIVAAAAGCSGVNVSKSISPLDFILPGLMQNQPLPPVVPLQTNAATLLASSLPTLAQFPVPQPEGK